MATDTRTLKQLAQEVLDVQNASNLSGVVHAWSRAITRLREVLREESLPDDTQAINTHAINKAWADKVAHLTDTQYSTIASISPAYKTVHNLAEKV